MKHLIKQRWWWISLIIIILVLLYVHNNVYQRLKTDQIERTFEELHTKAELAKILVDVFPVDSSNVIDLQTVAKRIKQRIGVRTTFIATDGIVVADSEVEKNNLKNLDNHKNRPEVLQAQQESFGKSYRYSRTVKHDLFYVAISVEKPTLVSGFLRLSYYSERVQTWIATTRTIFMISFFSTTFALWIIIGFILYKTTSNWHQVTEVAKAVKTEEMPEIPIDKLKGESQVVGDAFNVLTSRIKDYNQQVKDERQYLQEAFNSLEDAIVVVDDKHRIIIKNTKFQSNFSDNSQELMGENILQMIRSAEVMDSLEKAIEKTKSLDFEFEFLNKQERQFYYCKIQPIEHYEGNLFLLFFRDITKIKRLEAMRRDFVANVSHEMKTPISSLIGYTETLLDHPDIKHEQKERYLKRSLIQAKKMQALVTDLLQLSEFEQGKEIEHSSFSLKTFLEEVVSNNLAKANKKQQNLVMDLHDPEIIIQADRKQITIVMDNLLQNAISYTPEKGKIKIYSTELDENKISVFVQDDGAGIESKYIDRIFQRFYRVDNSRETHKTGTGLGLSIVKHIIEAHEQHVGVDSVPNEGSTFWFTLNRF